MTPLILANDSGLKGAFVWMKDGVVTDTLLTATMVKNGKLGGLDALGRWGFSGPAVAYIEQPVRMRGKGEGGIETAFINTGRIEERLRILGYRIVRVLPKVWQDDLLDLSKYEIWTEKECKPRLAEGWRLTPVKGAAMWRLRSDHGTDVSWACAGRDSAIEGAERIAPTSVVRTKQVLSHDTKAASIAYAREHFPGVDLVPPRSRNPHDGLADALCIAAWATKQLNKET